MERKHRVTLTALLLGATLTACGGSASPTASSSPVSLGELANSLDITGPSAPSNLTWNASGMTVTLTWGASTDDSGVIQGYELWYGSFFLGLFSDTAVSLIGFKPSTPYAFTVKARDDAGNVSVASNQITVLLGPTQDTTPPTAPTNLKAVTIADTSARVSWTASSDDVGVVVYQIYANGVLSGTVAAGTSATVAGLSPSTAYSITITASDAAGNVSPASAPLSVTTLQGVDTTPPTPPTNQVASTLTRTTVTLSWSASADNVGVAGYTVYNGNVVVASSAGLAASVSGLTPGNTYSFTVVAFDAAGNVSASSNSVSVGTPIGYTLTIATSGSGTTSPAAGTYSYPAGAVVSVTATPSSNYTFSGWSGAATGTSNPVSIVVTGNATLTATFTAVQSSLSINVGGAATGTFVADQYFTGGTTYSNTNTIDTSALSSSSSVPAAVFQSERYGEFTYTVPSLTAGSPYIVSLYFAETYLTAAGARAFDVAINGTTALSGFDIYAAAGAQNKAVARSFNATATSAGQIAIQLSTGSSGVENPKLCGITIAPGSLPTYTLTVSTTAASGSSGSVTGGGISCGSTCTANVVQGGSVTLTAVPGTGSMLSSWGGACSGTSTTCTVTMDAAKSVTAAFIVGNPAQGPCDIYEAAGTPCVAAHSTARALYASYTGKLYQLRRADNTTKDISVLAAGGFADTATQDSFCSGSSSCVISIIYDQSGKGNHLPIAGWSTYMSSGKGSNAADGKTTVGGHTVHGIYVTSNSNYVQNKAPNVAYRLTNSNGVAKGNQAQTMYMVVDGTRYSSQCCFGYGNAETSGMNDGNGTMEALYWGTDTAWGGRGDGNGPWIAADLENGMFKGNATCNNCNSGPWPNSKSLTHKFVTAMLKGPAANTFTLKGGNAQSGTLTTMWNGARPTPNYYPKKLQGAIILGTGGDGSSGGTGTWFEGAMTSGVPSDAVDEAVQANIVAAGYGK
jgi:uncharacterized repeat protein (TIGR02543 family)